MISFLEKLRATLAAHQMMQAGDRVLAGVSGGADSVALLLALKDLGYEVTVAHLNHGLRGEESEHDQQFVQALSAKLGVPCFVDRVDLSGASNTENAAREARRKFFRSLTIQYGFSKIALAHHQEDRVETFLLHLMRGTGNTGLVSMSPVSGDIIRPLLEHTKEEIESFLGGRGQGWRVDSSNADMSFARNRMRGQFLPQLANAFNPRLIESVTRTLLVLQDEELWMTGLAQEWLARNSSPGGLDVGALSAAPVALVRRVIREALRDAGSGLVDLSFDHVEAVRSLLAPGKSGKVVQLPGQFNAAREFDRLTFLRKSERPADLQSEFEYQLSIPGVLHIPELRTEFRARYVEGATDPAADAVAAGDRVRRALVDGDRLGACVKIRSWQSGDYYRPAGSPSGKLKKLFQRARVPRSQRHRTPVIAVGSAIVWVVSFPVSREFLPDSRSKKIVAFDALPD